MLRLKYGFIFIILCIKTTYSQWSVDLGVGDYCTLKTTGGQGECKLFSDCDTARDDWTIRRKRPQHCGFQGMEQIVCCPSSPRKTLGDKSKEKCKEYAQYVFASRPSPIIGDPPIVRNECGHRVVKLIVGGDKAGRTEFPHMARIGYELTPGDVEWACGGTIISDNYILTAGHCLSNKQLGNATVVRMGVTKLTTKNKSNKQDIKVAERIRYPEYKAGSHYHDIALLRLEEPIKLNPKARPACLYLDHDIHASKAIATGWGLTTYGGEGSDDLLKVTLDLFDHATCNASYKSHIRRKLNQGILDDSQVCAGSKTGEEKDACQGDSGGPLQIYHINDDIKCMYDIIGVTSFGKVCGTGDPGVYSRVSNYIEWIEKTVWP